MTNELLKTSEHRTLFAYFSSLEEAQEWHDKQVEKLEKEGFNIMEYDPDLSEEEESFNFKPIENIESGYEVLIEAEKAEYETA